MGAEMTWRSVMMGDEVMGEEAMRIGGEVVGEGGGEEELSSCVAGIVSSGDCRITIRCATGGVATTGSDVDGALH